MADNTNKIVTTKNIHEKLRNKVLGNIQTLHELVALVKEHQCLDVDVSKLSLEVVKYLDQDPDDDSNDISYGKLHDIQDIPEGNIRFVYYESGGQGGSAFVTQRFNYHGTLIDVDYTRWSELEDGLHKPGTIYDTELTFSLVK